MLKHNPNIIKVPTPGLLVKNLIAHIDTEIKFKQQLKVMHDRHACTDLPNASTITDCCLHLEEVLP